MIIVCYYLVPGLLFGFAYYFIGYFAIGTPLLICLIGGGLFSILLNVVITSRIRERITLKEKYRILIKKYGETKTDTIIYQSISGSSLCVLMCILTQYHATGKIFNPYIYLVATVISSTAVGCYLLFIRKLACKYDSTHQLL